jgi:HEAT repeat protein
MKTLIEKLKGGNRRSLGKAHEVADEVRAKPHFFKGLIKGLLYPDPVVRMRAADAVAKITVEHPEYLRPYKKKFIEKIAQIEQQEVRWHAAQLFSRFEWTAAERRRVVRILYAYLKDKSKIVQVFAMQALADLAMRDAGLRNAVIKKIIAMILSGSPAVKSRGKRLLLQLNAIRKKKNQQTDSGFNGDG